MGSAKEKVEALDLNYRNLAEKQALLEIIEQLEKERDEAKNDAWGKTVLVNTILELVGSESWGESQVVKGLEDLARWMCGVWYRMHKTRQDAIALPPEECKDYISLKMPIVQGTRMQQLLRDIAIGDIEDQRDVRAAIAYIKAKDARKTRVCLL